MNGVTCPLCAAAATRRGSVGPHPRHRCAGCGAIFLWPQPDEATLAAIYGRHYYDAWGVGRDEAAARALKTATFAERLAELRDVLPAGGRVLDVGCATGYFLEAARAAGFEPYGVDLNAYGVAVCREKFGADRVWLGELESARFDGLEGRFDAIFMSDLIEHVRDPAAVLDAARRWIAPHGLLVVTTPWTDALSHRLAGSRWLHYKPEHLFYFGERSMAGLLARTGWTPFGRRPARKTLSLDYAAAQFASGGTAARTLSRLLAALPARLRTRPLRVRLGETTLLARPENR